MFGDSRPQTHLVQPDYLFFVRRTAALVRAVALQRKNHYYSPFSLVYLQEKDSRLRRTDQLAGTTLSDFLRCDRYDFIGFNRDFSINIYDGLSVGTGSNLHYDLLLVHT